ncbi:acetyltransferase [Vibrio sp. VB16]|uniref:acetyltransferase n=1 Tax=Vibrio sp. VB16 TaxID=2785746 RepID=UPI0018A0BA5D|nr:acetyltransferase [Vibrio sp. VB16]UGA54997.1 acetyltransferase [Vibrio sp. VB16]
MSRCAILGASGHGKVVAEIAELNQYDEIHFYDDRWPNLKAIEIWPVIGDTDKLLLSCIDYSLVIVAIGQNRIRLEKQTLLEGAGAFFKPLLHPSAVVSCFANIGSGSIVMANAVIGPFAVIGKSCIVNTSATVDHDCRISDGVHLSPGVNLAGGVNIGRASWLGIGSQVNQMINIGKDVMAGANSTVVSNIKSNQTIIGTPAKPIKNKG